MKYILQDSPGSWSIRQDSSITVPTGGIEVTDSQYDGLLNGSLTVTNGVVSTTPAPTQTQINAQQWVAYQAQAKAALEASDVTMHRILESVILGNTTTWTADEQAFVNWRRALRAILSQTQPVTIPTALPTKPPYPAGT